MRLQQHVLDVINGYAMLAEGYVTSLENIQELGILVQIKTQIKMLSH